MKTIQSSSFPRMADTIYTQSSDIVRGLVTTSIGANPAALIVEVPNSAVWTAKTLHMCRLRHKENVHSVATACVKSEV